MALLRMSCDVDGPLRGITALKDSQLAFTIARALTMTAQDAQKVVQQVERGTFRLRNDWTVRNTRITPATKQTLMAEIYTDTGNRKTGAPDYLPRQEESGDKVPANGHRYLAIPTRYLFRYTPRTRPIPDNLRPAALLPANAMSGATYAGTFSAGSRAGGTNRLVSRATLKRLKSGDFEAFLQTTQSGTLCIFVRHGGLAGQGSHDAEPWYLLTAHAHVPAIFPMFEVVQVVVNSNFEANVTRASAEVGLNDLLRGSGLQSKF